MALPQRWLSRIAGQHSSGPIVRVAAIAIVATALAGCAGPLSALDPAGPAAGSIARLWWVMFAGAMLLFALVMFLFATSFLRRGRAGGPPQRWIVLGGLVLPAIVLIPLVGYGLFAGQRLLPLPGSAPPRIEVHAYRWGWTVRYPDSAAGMPVTTTDVLHLPAGAPVDLVITSEDVIHAVWIPRLAGKMDAVPGRTNVLRLQADEPGRYHGTCAEFCGTGHAQMRFEVVVHRAADYAAALAQAAEKKP